jgi:hypothetical protein
MKLQCLSEQRSSAAMKAGRGKKVDFGRAILAFTRADGAAHAYGLSSSTNRLISLPPKPLLNSLFRWLHGPSPNMPF